MVWLIKGFENFSLSIFGSFYRQKNVSGPMKITSYYHIEAKHYCWEELFLG
jgi:hypothetical protein